MTRLAERKSRLTFVTEATVRYRGKHRPLVIEVDGNGYSAAVRLSGSRTRYEFSWLAVHDMAAEVFARRERERRKAERIARKKGQL